MKHSTLPSWILITATLLSHQALAAVSDSEMVGGAETPAATSGRDASDQGIDSSSAAASVDWDVSNSGSLSYGIPIQVPPGPGGVSPALALDYDSHAPNGMLGVGWALSGLPAIERVAHNRGRNYDGGDWYAFSSGGVGATPSAGSRLIGSGSSTKTYHTADESWREFREEGSCGDGPCSFVMRDVSGTEYTFGGTDDSQLQDRTGRGVQSWALSQVTDLHGNTYSVTYLADDTMLYPSAITYATSQTMSGRSRMVLFEYETRGDPTRLPTRYEKRLTQIHVAHGLRVSPTTIRRYHLDYKSSELTGRSLLASVQESGATAEATLPAIEFTYPVTVAAPDGAWDTIRATLGGTEGIQTLAGDVNGDGFDDVVRVSHDRSGRSVRYALGNKSGLGPDMTAFMPGDHKGGSSFLADVNGDGKRDLVSVRFAGTNPSVNIAYGMTTGLNLTPTDIPSHVALNAMVALQDIRSDLRAFPADVDGNQIDDIVLVNVRTGDVAVAMGHLDGPTVFVRREGITPPSPSFRAEPLAIDLSGDGLDEIVLMYTDDTAIEMVYFQGTNSGIAEAQSLNWIGGATDGYSPYQMLSGDLDADGFADLTLAYSGKKNITGNGLLRPYWRDIRSMFGFSDLESYADADYVPQRIDAAADALGPYDAGERASYEAYWRHHVADINGDGRSDLVMVYDGEQGTIIMDAQVEPNGRFDTWRTVYSDIGQQPDGGRTVHKWNSHIADVNGDYRDDLIRYYHGAQGQQIDISYGTRFGLSLPETLVFSTAPIAELATAPDPSWANSVALLTPDINGDGNPDILSGAIHNYRVSFSEPVTVDAITQVRNGYGATISVKHEPAAHLDGTIQSDDSCMGSNGPMNGPECGIANTAARSLVRSVTVNDGVREQHAATFSYDNGRVQLGALATDATVRTRADLGFASTKKRAALIDLETTTTFRQDWPYHGNPRTKDLGHGTTLLHDWNYQYNHRTTDFATLWVHQKSSNDAAYESDDLGVIHYSEPTYNDLGQLIANRSCKGPACTESTFTYETDKARWILNRVIKSRTKNATTDNLLSWDEKTYVDDNLNSTRSLLCQSAEECACFADADSCVMAGKATWVTQQSERDHDSQGNLRSVKDALGRTTTYGWDDHNAQIATQERVVKDTTHRTEAHYDGAGRLERFDDLNGNSTSYTYDDYGRLTRLDHPDGGYELFAAKNLGTPGNQYTQHKVFAGFDGAGKPDYLWNKKYFDGLGTTIRTEQSGQNTVVILHGTWPEVGGRRVATSEPHYEDAPASSLLWTELHKDRQGRQTLVRRMRGAVAVGNLHQTTYFVNRKLEHHNSANQYDSGALGTALMRTSEYIYDETGKLTKRIDAADGVTTYSYDTADRVDAIIGPETPTGINGPLPVVQWYYDGFGRRIRMEDSVLGTAEFTYDAGGNLRSRETEVGPSLSYVYDDLDRMRRIKNADTGSILSKFDYDNPMVPNGIGRIDSFENQQSSTSILKYDAMGRTLAQGIRISGLPETYFESYKYDEAGRERFTQLPDGSEIEVAFHKGGPLLSVKYNKGVAMYDKYSPHGRPGLRKVDGVTSKYTYLPTGQLASLHTIGDNDVVQDYRYNYDARQNVRSIHDVRVGTTRLDTWSYEYDKLDRLSQAADHKKNTIDYGYDPQGNITRRGDLDIKYTPHYIVANENGTERYSAKFDAVGNMVTKTNGIGEWTYSYDHERKLTEVRLDGTLKTANTYDAMGRRVRKLVQLPNGKMVTAYYVTPNFELRHSSVEPETLVGTRHIEAPGFGKVATVTTKSIYGRINGMTDSGVPEGVLLHHPNHIGSASLVTDQQGRPQSRSVFSPFGTRRNDLSEGKPVVTHRFAGSERDDVSGLDYFGARFYDNEMARFTTADTVLPGGGLVSQGLNRYAYVLNNPIKWIDPDGHRPKKQKTFTLPAQYVGGETTTKDWIRSAAKGKYITQVIVRVHGPAHRFDVRSYKGIDHIGSDYSNESRTDVSVKHQDGSEFKDHGLYRVFLFQGDEDRAAERTFMTLTLDTMDGPLRGQVSFDNGDVSSSGVVNITATLSPEKERIGMSDGRSTNAGGGLKIEKKSDGVGAELSGQTGQDKRTEYMQQLWDDNKGVIQMKVEPPTSKKK